MKNKVTAALFALFLGPLGIHRFYLNQTGKGIMYLLFCWFPVVWLIAFIDFFVFLFMSDEDFDRKYNPYKVPTYARQRPREDYFRPEPRPHTPRKQPVAPTPPKETTNPYKEEGTKLYRDYDFKGAIKQYQKSLRLHPHDAIVHFNLACLYSLQEEVQHAYLHLSKAVENGFNLYDKIQEHGHLAYLRTQPDFDTFVANGYRLSPIQQALPPREADEIDLMSDEVILKLEKLGDLKAKGILTEEEFQRQKAKILKA